MSDLTGIFNQTSPETVINLAYEAYDKPRKRLGLSEIGHPCKRYLWYRYHGRELPPVPGQVLRLFNLGNIIEDAVKDDFRLAGYTIRNEQKALYFVHNGVTLYGHIDGVIEGLIESEKAHILEIKTANEKSFADLKKKGNYEVWNPKYKAQVHAYMLGCGLTRALAVVYNKNTSELYTERIRLEKEYVVNLLADVFSAIAQGEPPEKHCPKPDWYEAKFCGYYDECF